MAVDVHVRAPLVSQKSRLTKVAFVAASPCLVQSGQRLQCPSCQPEQKPIGRRDPETQAPHS